VTCDTSAAPNHPSGLTVPVTGRASPVPGRGGRAGGAEHRHAAGLAGQYWKAAAAAAG